MLYDVLNLNYITTAMQTHCSAWEIIKHKVWNIIISLVKRAIFGCLDDS